MKTRNIPGFNAEASMFTVTNNYRASVNFDVGVAAKVTAALAATGTLECGGTCPDGAILCKGTHSCQCCKTGCAVDKEGNAFCTHDPITLTGRGGSSFGSAMGGFAVR
jgi:hypothetical protein